MTLVGPVLLRAHPRPASWSALEYGCHGRDVLRCQRDRVLLAQAEDNPVFTSMRLDERAVEESYNEQDPRSVARQLTTKAPAGACWRLSSVRARAWGGRRRG